MHSHGTIHSVVDTFASECRIHYSRIGENVLETETNDQFEMKTFPIGNNFEYALILDTVMWKKENKKKKTRRDGGNINK